MQQVELRPMSAYDKAPNIVLLGDPGAGKSHTFRECAVRSGGQLITARNFLVTPSTNLTKRLFIDGLDEKRGGRTDRDTVDALVEKLFDVAPTHVRISCRVADWLGESDLAALRPYFEQSGGPVVLQLDRLNPDEQALVLQGEGLSIAQAERFLEEADSRGLGDFLDNPQNLLMLQRAVRGGAWPATRRELFQSSTELMLKESNEHRARFGAGVLSPDELRPIAGAICAARLISDIAGISLTDQETDGSYPSYRGLTLYPPERVMAALTRRVFEAGAAAESVDYAHRTTAEYLGAAWLADRVRNGMPFGRLQALMGVDGHPAAELRGLHAWLAVHLPEYADALIDTDPYGVLTYGDASALSTSSCAHLVRALGELSQKDPWFRSGHWHNPSIGALSRPDMVKEFRAVLHDENAGFGVRSIVVEAMAYGTPLAALKDDLTAVVLRAASPFAERLEALIALLRIGTDGKASARAAYKNLGADSNGLRLRHEILGQLYGDPYGAEDAAELLSDMARSTSSDGSAGILHGFTEELPLADLPAILDRLPLLNQRQRAAWRNEWEVARFIDRALLRVWTEIDAIEPGRALQWLRLRNSYSRGYGRGSSDELRQAIQARPELLNAIAGHFFATVEPGNARWLQLTRLREISFFSLTPAQLLGHITAHLGQADAGSARETFLYESALIMAFSSDWPDSGEVFDTLYAMAKDRDDLRRVRDAMLVCALPARLDLPEPEDSDEQSPEELRAKFGEVADAVRSGNHLGWIAWAAQVYFGLFADLDEGASPRARVIETLGEELAEAAFTGFVALLSRPDLPLLNDIVTGLAQGKRWDWWFGIAAGLREKWEEEPGLIGISDELLQAMLAFDITNPVFETADGVMHEVVPPWKASVLKERPELARDAYVAVARTKLPMGGPVSDSVHELMTSEAFEPFRADVVIELLQSFPGAERSRLAALLDGVIATPAAHAKFLDLAGKVLGDANSVGQPQHDMWLAVAYLLAPAQHEAQLEAAAKRNRAVVFEVRDRSGNKSHGSGTAVNLSLPQLAVLARLTGSLYANAAYPPAGWRGSTNEWDAAEFCRDLITAISALASENATNELKRLEADPTLASYNHHIRHALASQEKRRRDAEYDRPDWPNTIKALADGAPATVADLHALVCDQLADLRERIARENTDIYKSFWNLDRHSRPVNPRPEEPCRDTLVTLLRPPLTPKGITVEPEGHMAADKRVDISVAMPKRKILCELKRDFHPDLWTAADQQLERFYAHDPDAKGFGVYAVFWFGSKRSALIPRHPEGLTAPGSAAELEQMLRDRIPADRRARLAVMVIDVSGPPRSTAKRKNSSPKKKRAPTKQRTQRTAVKLARPRSAKSKRPKKSAAKSRKAKKTTRTSKRKAHR
jgi:predicted NACHT family NTPase